MLFVSALARLRHPSIIHFYGAVYSTSASGARFPQWLVMEPATFTLTQFFKKLRKLGDDFSLESLHDLAIDVLEGLAYMHSLRRPCVHWDIKPDNIFVVVRPRCRPMFKLGDFGSCEFADSSGKFAGTTPTVLFFRAPEAVSGVSSSRSPLEHSKYTTAVDVFSFGMTLASVVVEHLSCDGSIPRPVELTWQSEERSFVVRWPD